MDIFWLSQVNEVYTQLRLIAAGFSSPKRLIRWSHSRYWEPYFNSYDHNTSPVPQNRFD